MSVRAMPRAARSVGLTGRLRGRPGIVAGVVLVALALSVVVGVGLGSVRIGPADSIGVILWRTFGLDLGRTWTPATETIVWDLRMPRVLTAMLVGAALAVAGATFQGLIRNPLADPYVLGTASGAALGAAIAVVLPISIVVVEFGHDPRPRLRRRPHHGVRRGPARRRRIGRPDPPVADRLRGRVDPGRAADDGDVHVRAEPARDLLVPARRPRRVVVDPPGGRHADRARGLRRDRVARADPRWAAARRHRRGPSRHRCPQGARHPARDGGHGDGRGGRHQRADRVRRSGRATRRPAGGRVPGRAA